MYSVQLCVPGMLSSFVSLAWLNACPLRGSGQSVAYYFTIDLHRSRNCPWSREQAELCPRRQIILQVLGNDWHLKDNQCKGRKGPSPLLCCWSLDKKILAIINIKKKKKKKKKYNPWEKKKTNLKFKKIFIEQM